jgi:hypothetical protein
MRFLINIVADAKIKSEINVSADNLQQAQTAAIKIAKEWAKDVRNDQGWEIEVDADSVTLE